MLALVLMDQALRHRAQCGDVGERCIPRIRAPARTLACTATCPARHPRDSRRIPRPCARSRRPIMKTVTVAVVGATGAVGEAMLSILDRARLPGRRTDPAGQRALRRRARSDFRDRDIVVQDLATFDPAGVDIALFSAGGAISKEYAPKFAAAGAVVIDNSSAFRYDDDVPLVVTEVNPEAMKNRPARHHRQPELLDHADAGRAGADPSRGRHRAHQRRAPTSRCPARGRTGDGGTRAADRARCSTSRTPSRRSSRCRSPST